jgi:hypothetical protein
MSPAPSARRRQNVGKMSVPRRLRVVLASPAGVMSARRREHVGRMSAALIRIDIKEQSAMTRGGLARPCPSLPELHQPCSSSSASHHRPTTLPLCHRCPSSCPDESAVRCSWSVAGETVNSARLGVGGTVARSAPDTATLCFPSGSHQVRVHYDAYTGGGRIGRSLGLLPIVLLGASGLPIVAMLLSCGIVG